MKARLLGFSVVFVFATLFSSVRANAWMYMDAIGNVVVGWGPCVWWVGHNWDVNEDGSHGTAYLECIKGPCGSGQINWNVVNNPPDPNHPTSISNYSFSGDFTNAQSFEAEVFNDFMNRGVYSCSWSIDNYSITPSANGTTYTAHLDGSLNSTSCISGYVTWQEIANPPDPNNVNNISNYTFSGDFTDIDDLEFGVFYDLMVSQGAKSNNGHQTVNSNAGAHWDIYPNPGYNIIKLYAADAAIGDNYQVTNLLGQVILRGTIIDRYNDLDIRSLSGGVYLLNVLSANDKIQVLKFIKQ
ncbi:MAG: C-terminal target protein [Flavipsychrobacter sp.]|jgi:hypothetical protein|nr:C-terminal target protein [Flavipsychrobacter sp.]